MAFRTEQDMVRCAKHSAYFRNLVDRPGREGLLEEEPDGLFGVPDLLIATVGFEGGEDPSLAVFAFEMKLTNWPRALIQAFRYKAFADRSFVVLDADYVHRAVASLQRFERSGVGLLSIAEDSSVIEHFMPSRRTPYCEPLHLKAKQRVFNAIAVRQLVMRPAAYS